MHFFRRSSNSPRYLLPATKRGHVQRDHALAAQEVGHLVGHDELGQPLDDGGLAHAGLADEQRVVLLAAGEHLHDALDLARAADDRVQLAVARLLGQVGAELLQHAVGRAARGVERVAAGVDRALPHQVVERAAHVVARHAQAARAPPSAVPSPSRTMPSSRCSVEM